MKNMKKTMALLLAVALLVGVAVGTTIAWLTDKTEKVTNTFTAGTIDVDLVETKEDFKMIPGWTIDKDPAAWVTEGSEEGYLFVKVEKSANFDTYMDYAIAEPWQELETGVYYIKITEEEVGKKFIILGDGSAEYDDVTYSWKDNQVLVKPTVTKDMMDALNENTFPTMTFTAYASQLYKTNKGGEETQFTAAEAWALVKPNP